MSDSCTANIIAAANIVVSAGVGIWLIIVIQKKMANTRATKDYFISELKDIRIEYGNFFNGFVAGKYNGQYILGWLKVMNMRVVDVESCLKEEFQKCREITLKESHQQLRTMLSESGDFNTQFKQKINPSESLTTDVFRIYGKILEAYHKTVICVNK